MNRTETDDLYYDIGKDIQDLLQMILGDRFDVWATGTINPDYYEGHKKSGDMAGLQITINLPEFKPHPTREQIEAYFNGLRE